MGKAQAFSLAHAASNRHLALLMFPGHISTHTHFVSLEGVEVRCHMLYKERTANREDFGQISLDLMCNIFKII